MTSLTEMPQVQSALDMRLAILVAIDKHLRDAVTTAPVGPNGDLKVQASGVLGVFEAAVTGYENIVDSMLVPASLPHGLRILSEDEQEGLAQVRHNLNILRALYGPKEA